MANDLNAQQVGIQRRAAGTEPKANVLTGRTKFPMSYAFLNTSRYGEVSPFYYQHVKGDDTIPLQSEHELRTHTLASPMLSDVQMQKLYAFVPMEAIYPRNWERMLVAPDKGEDVPDDTRCYVSNLITSISSFFSKLNSSELVSDLSVIHRLRYVFLLESIFSNGSLFSEFNIHLSHFFSYNGVNGIQTFDQFFDTVFVPFLKSKDCNYVVDGVSYRFSPTNSYFYLEGVHYVNSHYLLDLLRSNRWSISYDVVSPFTLDDFSFFDYFSFKSDSQSPINLEVIISYQLCCWQFFTDSKIDYYFSAERFRAGFESIFYSLVNSIGSPSILTFPATFSQNSEVLLYDTFSGFVISRLFSVLTYSWSSIESSHLSYVFDLLSLLFTHRNSLRYGDYFVTGRTRPYGIGMNPSSVDPNVGGSVSVVDGKVSVLDITKKLQYQRFWNSVAWSGQKIGDYVKDVLGVQSRQNVPNTIPQFIANQRFGINGYEVENTGANQTEANSITTLVKTKQSKFAFEYNASGMGIILGLRSYDCARIYSKTFDRMHMSKNRYDDFIPEMQFVGDQQIYQREIDSTKGEAPFAYTMRYMPMKIRYNYAAGGFINDLPSWAFITDNNDGNRYVNTIDPDYIRSTPAEFDRFYSSLTGYSLGSYFHFIHKDINYQDLTRDLVYAPQPLK